MTDTENKNFTNEVYGFYYDRLKLFMTEDGWVVKDIFEINYFGTEVSRLFDFKVIDDVWFVRPNFFCLKKRTKNNQMLSINFSFQRSATEALVLYMDQQREMFQNILESKGISNCICNPYDKNFQEVVLSIVCGSSSLL